VFSDSSNHLNYKKCDYALISTSDKNLELINALKENLLEINKKYSFIKYINIKLSFINYLNSEFTFYIEKSNKIKTFTEYNKKIKDVYHLNTSLHYIELDLFGIICKGYTKYNQNLLHTEEISYEFLNNLK
jgi:hypothetical protein